MALSSAPKEKFSFNLKNAAFQKGYKELESALPLVKPECDEAYCAKFEQLDLSEKQSVRVGVYYRLPLTIALRKKTFTISASARHVVERELVDENLDLDARQEE